MVVALVRVEVKLEYVCNIYMYIYIYVYICMYIYIYIYIQVELEGTGVAGGRWTSPTLVPVVSFLEHKSRFKVDRLLNFGDVALGSTKKASASLQIKIPSEGGSHEETGRYMCMCMYVFILGYMKMSFCKSINTYVFECIYILTYTNIHI
jgi:hypothetical protein